MRKQSRRRIGQSVPSDPTIVVIGAASGNPLAATLGKAFSRVVFCEDLTAFDFHTGDLAVGIFGRSDEESITSFAKQTHLAAVTAVCVMFAEHETLIGPVSLTGRPGCARCAWERMLAASQLEHWPTELAPLPEIAKETGRALTREARAILRRGAVHSHLVDHVLAVDREPENAALHQLVPLARCRACGGAEAFARPPHESLQLSPDDPPEIVLDALAGWVDQRTGVISGVYLEPPVSAGLPIIATAAPPRIIDDDDSLHRLPIGWGKGFTISGAVLSAAGEAIERYSASLPDERNSVWKTAEELDGEYLDPRDLFLYSEAQYNRPGFPYTRYEPGIPHPWVRGILLGKNLPVWVPAVFAFLSFDLLPQNHICQGTSNGLATSTDQNDASLRAVLELIERDAFMTCWLTAQPARRITPDDTLDPLLHGVLDGIEALGATVEIYLLPTSVCGTTIMCLALGDGVRYPGATLGLGTGLDSRSALRQAVLELGQTGPYLQRMMHTNAIPIPDNADSVQEMLQHAAYYFPASRANAFDRLRNSNAPLALRDLPEGESNPSLESCASQLEAAGVRVTLVDVTSADVATGPFRVIRAVSPDLQPIWYGYGLERQPVARIRNRVLSPDMPPIHPIW